MLYIWPKWIAYNIYDIWNMERIYFSLKQACKLGSCACQCQWVMPINYIALERLKYNDFNNVILAYEDVTQVRQTRSSSPHPVYNWYNSQTTKKWKSTCTDIVQNRKNGVKRSKGTLVWTWPQWCDIQSHIYPT